MHILSQVRSELGEQSWSLFPVRSRWPLAPVGCLYGAIFHLQLRVGAVGILCIFSALALNLWPVGQWVTYSDDVSLGLPGTEMIRVNPFIAAELRQLTSVIKQHCDTFYSAPPIDSLYIYTGIPAPTGQLAELGRHVDDFSGAGSVGGVEPPANHR